MASHSLQAPSSSFQNPSLSSLILQASSPSVANNCSNSSTQHCRKALVANHDPPADCSTKALEIREYTMGLGEPTIASSPHACLLGPTSSKGDALHLPLSCAMEAPVTTHPLNPRTSSINPPNLQKTPNAPPNFRPCPAPISANSDASPANSDDPLANFGAFPAATDTYPGSPKPREPPPVPDIHHPSPTQHPGSSDLFRSITTTSGRPAFPNDPINVSARPDTRSQPTPTCSVELRQAPPPQPTYPKVLQ
ncbi:hypothetical protein C0989_003062 [Termitomyces sp. Mn162]|nr:hypothetical protein C0989_003062 [Termitomyces sp. Mn162]